MRLLKAIDSYTGQRIAPMRMPSAADVAARRAQAFKKRLLEASAKEGLEPSRSRSTRFRKRRRRRARTVRWYGCSSTPDVTRVCGRVTSPAPSRARPISPATSSAPSTKFTFVEIPSEYVDRAIERMRNVQIRSRPIVVKLAGGPPKGGGHRRGGPPKGGKGAARDKRAKRRHAA